MKTLFLSLSLLGVLIWTTLAADQPATDKTPPNAAPSTDTATDPRAADEAAIRAAGKAFIEAYNVRDAKELGGYGDGTWTRKGDKWLIQNSATLPDGGKATSLNIMTKLDNDSFKWESVNREIDGQLQPNDDPVIVIRKTDK